ncbi:MAG: phage tail protein, partial [Anaerolineae bacterium]|nr:phage tail protein [Anaerolineae bacterium]
MGILLTTTTKQDPTEDPFIAGKFSKMIVQRKIDKFPPPLPSEDIPFPGYLCIAMIDEKVVGLFQGLSDISVSREVEPFSQGGENDHTQELPKGISYGHVTLKTGYSTSKLFMSWMFAGQYNARPIYKNVD